MDVNTLISVVALAASLFVYWRKGGNQASNEANAALLQVNQANKLQIEALQKDVAGLQERERSHIGEIGRLKGVIEEKEKQIAILQSVDLSKNPQLMKFIENSAAREEQTLQALKNIAEFMNKITVHFEKEHAVSAAGAKV